MNKATMDRKITQIEKDVAAQAIIPPKKLYDHMKTYGRNITITKAEYEEINRLFHEWSTTVCTLAKSKLITINQLLDVIPEPWKTAFIKDLIRGVDESKRKK
jgi:hypothetical protein